MNRMQSPCGNPESAGPNPIARTSSEAAPLVVAALAAHAVIVVLVQLCRPGARADCDAGDVRLRGCLARPIERHRRRTSLDSIRTEVQLVYLPSF